MVNIFAAIVLTAFVVGAALYLWFRSVLVDITDDLMALREDLLWIADPIEDTRLKDDVLNICLDMEKITHRYVPGGPPVFIW